MNEETTQKQHAQRVGNVVTEGLKPCPFCSGIASYDTDGKTFWVICLKCGAKSYRTLRDGTRGKTIITEAWNRRTERATGRWVTLKDEHGDIVEAVCSNCQENGRHEWAFCPRCGARMQEEET